MALDARPPQQKATRLRAHEHPQLIDYRGPDWIDVAWNCTAVSRFRWRASRWRWSAFPLGIATRKGGKSAGYVNAIFLASSATISRRFRWSAWRKQGTLPVAVAVWLPDAVF